MKKSYLSQCVAALTAATTTTLAATAIQAQEVDEEVVVQGIRTSILNSIDVKRDADTIVEVVDAGDLASLPDASIADSLGRLPGVTTVRDSGQASQLNIRGMNGDFIQTTLNGREQATTASETESLRWMSFDQYPAELITQAAVYKSPKASLIEGGVAATVELKTVNPLEQSKDHSFNLNARLSYNDRAADVGAEETGTRFTASYSGKFADDKLGFAIGYSHLNQPNSFVRGRSSADGLLGFDSAVYDDQGDNNASNDLSAPLPSAYQFQAGSGSDTRDTIMATVVFEPTDNLAIQADYFGTEFKSEDLRHGIVLGAVRNGITGGFGEYTSFDPETYSGTYVITNSQASGDGGAWIETRSEDQSTQADSTAYGLNVEWAITEVATLTFDYSFSEGDKTRKDRLATMHHYAGYTEGDATWSETPNQSWTLVGNGDEIPTLTTNVDLTDLGAMHLGRYEEYPHLYTDEVDSFKVDFKYELDMPFISSIETGFRISERYFGAERGTFLWGSRQGLYNDGTDSYCADNLSANGDTSSPNYVECSPIAIDGFTSIRSTEGTPEYASIDIDGLADEVFGPGNYEGRKVWSRDWTFVESGDLREETDAIYLMANLDFEIGDIPVTGNIGVRHVETDVKAIGLVYVGNDAGTTITDAVGDTNSNFVEGEYGPEYTDTLPSLNLNFEITENDHIRLAMAEVIGRPPVGQMKGGAGGWFDNSLQVDVNGNGNYDEADGDVQVPRYNVWTKGSPYLDPFRASQVDLSYEHYFEEDGAVTVAAFYKDIESVVVPQNYGPGEINFEDLGVSIPESADPATVTGAFNTFGNAEGGYIQGIEVAGTKTFTTLPGALSGLGLTASYSYTESEISYSGGSLTPDNVSLPGLSENVWSATVFWDLGGFSTHLNTRYRDDYVLNIPIPGSTTPVLAKEYLTMDWQASYAFDMGLEIVFQANNLTDEPNLQSYGIDDTLGEFNQYGRQFYVGANYKF